MADRVWRDLGGDDPYEILGVSRDAGREDVIRAHRRLVRLLHPDLPGGSEERTKRLHLARDILLDPIARAEYDNHTAAAELMDQLPEPDLPGPWDTEDVVLGAGNIPAEPAPVRRPAPEFREPPLEGNVVPGPPFPQSHPQYPIYPPYPPRPPVRDSLALPITALVMAVLFAPAGLFLGLVALARSRRQGNARTISIVAVGISAGLVACCVIWSGLTALVPPTSP